MTQPRETERSSLTILSFFHLQSGNQKNAHVRPFAVRTHDSRVAVADCTVAILQDVYHGNDGLAKNPQASSEQRHVRFVESNALFSLVHSSH